MLLFRMSLLLFLVGVTCLNAMEGLSSKDGKLSRPVLFIHGFNADATSWGVDYVWDKCLYPNFKFQKLEMLNKKRHSAIRSSKIAFLPDSNGDERKSVSYNLVNTSYGMKVSGDIECNDGRIIEVSEVYPHTFTDAKKYKEFVMFNTITGTPLDTSAHYLVNDKGYYSMKLNESGVVFEVQDLNRISIGGNKIAEKPLVEIEIDFKNWMEELQVSKKGFISQSKDNGDLSVNYKKGLNDKVMKYAPNSIPYALATFYNLNTDFDPDSIGKGINRNGIYFYNSKSNTSSCEVKNKSVKLGQYESVWESDARVANLFNHHETQEVIIQHDKICIDPNGKETVTKIESKQEIKYGFEIFEYGRIDHNEKECWEESLESGKECSGIVYDLRLDSTEIYLKGDELIIQPKKFDEYNLFYEYLGKRIDQNNFSETLFKPVPKKSYLDGFIHPTDTIDKQEPQIDQLKRRLSEVLDSHYGEKWKTNKNLKVDLVGHSQGGLLAKELFRSSGEASVLNPIAHVNRVITLNTPFNGSALATSPGKMEVGHYLYGHSNGVKIGHEESDALARTYEAFPVLAEKKRLINGTTPIEIEGVIDVKDLLNSFINGGLEVVEHISLGLLELEEIDFTLKGPSVYGPFTIHFGEGFSKRFGIEVLGEQKNGMNFAKDFEQKAEHLSWSEESPFVEENFKMKNLKNPLTNAKVPLTTYRTNGMSNVLSENINSNFSKILGEGLCESIKKVMPTIVGHDNGFKGCGNDFVKNIENFDIDDDVLRIYADALDIDKEWTDEGDLVVEASSQSGYRTGGDFDFRSNKLMRVKQHTVDKGRIPHVNGLGELVNKAKGAAWQAESILCELLNVPEGFDKCDRIADFNWRKGIENILQYENDIESPVHEILKLGYSGEIRISLSNKELNKLKNGALVLSDFNQQYQNEYRKLFYMTRLKNGDLQINNKVFAFDSNHLDVLIKWEDNKVQINLNDEVDVNLGEFAYEYDDLLVLNKIKTKKDYDSESKNWKINTLGSEGYFYNDYRHLMSISRKELSIVNNLSEVLIEGQVDKRPNDTPFKYLYVLQKSDVESPTVILNSSYPYEYEIKNLFDNMKVVELKVPSFEVLKNHPVTIISQWNDYRAYEYSKDFSHPNNLNSYAQISSLMASKSQIFIEDLKSFSAKNKEGLEYKVEVLERGNNLKEFKIKFRNLTKKGLSFKFYINGPQELIVNTYYAENCTISKLSEGQTLSFFQVDCESDSKLADGLVHFGVHNKYWSDMGVLNSNIEELSAYTPFEYSNFLDHTVYKNLSKNLKETYNGNKGSTESKIWIKNESPTEENYLKLRIKIDVGEEYSDSINFKLDTKIPWSNNLVIEKFYTDFCTVDELIGETLMLLWNCENRSHEILPDQQGWVLGIHNQNWTPLEGEWIKSNDWIEYD